ncbi:MAG: zinc ribbon domain-containing protein [Thermomicrobiaceae bacterium]|nr:zinc ribbon domain-containing protein [Thermomicrobiaceae bacterium]
MEALLARAVQLLVALGGAYLVALWFALAVWTFQDIQSRSRSVIAQIFSTLVVVLFFVPGVLIYLILRPKETLDEAFQRSLEEEYLLQDLEELPLCPTCQRYVHDDFVFCPSCRTELRQACASCERLIDLRWDICPYCGAEQYPEEEPAYGPEPEYVPEPVSVSRLVQQARDRIASRLSRPAESAAPGEAADGASTVSLEPVPAAIGAEGDGALMGRQRQRGAGREAGGYSASNGRRAAEPRDGFQTTDELPTTPARPQV